MAAGIVDRETLDAAGELLEAHVRLEEQLGNLLPGEEGAALLASRVVSVAEILAGVTLPDTARPDGRSFAGTATRRRSRGWMPSVRLLGALGLEVDVLN